MRGFFMCSSQLKVKKYRLTVFNIQLNDFNRVYIEKF